MKRTSYLRRGWVAQVEQIYASRYRDFVRVAHAIVGDAHGARLAVHGTFVNAVAAPPSRDTRGASVESHLWRVLLSAAPEQRLGRLTAVDPEPAKQFRLAADRLPIEEQHALYLRRFGGLDDVEVGAVLGLEPDAVELMVARACQALASVLAPDTSQEDRHERQAV